MLYRSDCAITVIGNAGGTILRPRSSKSGHGTEAPLNGTIPFTLSDAAWLLRRACNKNKAYLHHATSAAAHAKLLLPTRSYATPVCFCCRPNVVVHPSLQFAPSEGHASAQSTTHYIAWPAATPIAIEQRHDNISASKTKRKAITCPHQCFGPRR